MQGRTDLIDTKEIEGRTDGKAKSDNYKWLKIINHIYHKHCGTSLIKHYDQQCDHPYEWYFLWTLMQNTDVWLKNIRKT